MKSKESWQHTIIGKNSFTSHFSDDSTRKRRNKIMQHWSSHFEQSFLGSWRNSLTRVRLGTGEYYFSFVARIDQIFLSVFQFEQIILIFFGLLSFHCMRCMAESWLKRANPLVSCQTIWTYARSLLLTCYCWISILKKWSPNTEWCLIGQLESVFLFSLSELINP